MGDIHAIAIRRLASRSRLLLHHCYKKITSKNIRFLKKQKKKKHPKLFYDTKPYIVGFSVLFSIVWSILCQIKLFGTSDNFREIVHFESAVIQLTTFTYIYNKYTRKGTGEEAFCHLIDQICLVFLKKKQEEENN